MTSEPEKSGPTDTDDRKQPADGPVLDLRDADRAEATAPKVDDTPMIDSSLVGAGDGLPAAERRTGDDRPDRTEADKASAAVAPDEDRGTTTSASAPASTVTAKAGRPASAEPAHATRRRGGFAPLFLGGVVAAGLGAGAAWWAIPRPPAGPDAAALTSQVQADVQAATDSIREDAVAAATQAARAEIATADGTAGNPQREGRAGQRHRRSQRRDQGRRRQPGGSRNRADARCDAGRNTGGRRRRRRGGAQADRRGPRLGRGRFQPAGHPVRPGQPASRAGRRGEGGAGQHRHGRPARKAGPDWTAGGRHGRAVGQAGAAGLGLAARPTADPAQIQRLQSLAEDAQDIQSRIEARRRLPSKSLPPSATRRRKHKPPPRTRRARPAPPPPPRRWRWRWKHPPQPPTAARPWPTCNRRACSLRPR